MLSREGRREGEEERRRLDCSEEDRVNVSRCYERNSSTVREIMETRSECIKECRLMRASGYTRLQNGLDIFSFLWTPDEDRSASSGHD